MEVRVREIKERGGLTPNQTQYIINLDDFVFEAQIERLSYDHEQNFAKSTIMMYGGGLRFMSKIEVFHQRPWVYVNEVWDYIEEYGQDVITHLFLSN
jgi:hypothetical protein